MSASASIIGRALLVAALLGAGCGGDGGGSAGPMIVPGGGVGGGDIDGAVHVYVIDEDTDAVISGATVRVGDTQGTTDATGLFTVEDVAGPQTIIAATAGYDTQMWIGVNGENVTIPLRAVGGAAEVPEAQLSGTIAGWTSLSPAAGHYFLAFVTYSRTGELGDPANEIAQPVGDPPPGMCFRLTTGGECNWTIHARTGPIAVYAIIYDGNTNGTPLNFDDDTHVMTGIAIKDGLVVTDGVNQSGVSLDPIASSSLVSVSIDAGTPPAGLTLAGLIGGVELTSSGVVEIANFRDPNQVVVPNLSAIAGATGYRLLAIAGDAMAGEAGPMSAVVRQGLATPADLVVDSWLSPPAGIVASATQVSFTPVASAELHNLELDGPSGRYFSAAFFDGSTSVTLPDLVTVPTGTTRVTVGAFDGTIDLQDFSVDHIFDDITHFANNKVTFTH